MAIHKRVHDPSYPGQHKHLVLPAFSFEPTDGLAQLIVDIWGDSRLQAKLLERDRKTKLPTPRAVREATTRVKRAGYDLTRAVIITETEHDSDYIMQSDDEIVFVLPSKKRVASPAANLLDTAKLLMACTPNGI
jgi:hypothetical protein